jgi:integrase/recombinase XerD
MCEFFVHPIITLWQFFDHGVHYSRHSLRFIQDTFITNLTNKGVGVRVLPSLAGHKSINTTQIYIKTNDEIKRNAVELI